jgi:TRAP-type C4-dicarboxylate transport system permease small subunit
MQMDTRRIVAILLIAAGALGLAYGGFTYTSDTHEAELGPLSLSVDEKEFVTVPVWLGIGFILIGSLLLLPGRK